jgi:hypothetical protein
MGAEVLPRLLGAALVVPGVASVLSRGLQAAFEARAFMDRTTQTVLGLLNVPSRADVVRLLGRLETIQGSLVNLNLKVDRLLASESARRRRTPRREARRADAPPE